MIPTSKGYRLPQTGDRNFWNDLNFNTQRLNDHKHDGVDSTALDIKDIPKPVQSILAAGWVAVTDEPGTFKQEVTLPGAYTLDPLALKFIVDGGSEDGNLVYPTIRKTATSKYEIFTNDITLTLKAIYG